MVAEIVGEPGGEEFCVGEDDRAGEMPDEVVSEERDVVGRAGREDAADGVDHAAVGADLGEREVEMGRDDLGGAQVDVVEIEPVHTYTAQSEPLGVLRAEDCGVGCGRLL